MHLFQLVNLFVSFCAKCHVVPYHETLFGSLLAISRVDIRLGHSMLFGSSLVLCSPPYFPSYFLSLALVCRSVDTKVGLTGTSENRLFPVCAICCSKPLSIDHWPLPLVPCAIRSFLVDRIQLPQFGFIGSWVIYWIFVSHWDCTLLLISIEGISQVNLFCLTVGCVRLLQKL